MPRGTDRYDEARIQGRLWTPAELRKVSFRYKAGTSPVTASTTISQLDDISGNANHGTSATAAQRPTFDPVGWKAPGRNMPAMTFDGGDRLTLTSTITYNGTNGMSIHAAIQQSGSATTRVMVGGASGSPQFRLETNHRLGIVRTNQANIFTSTATLATGWHVVGMDAATNLAVNWLNGQAETSSANPAFNVAASVVGVNGQGGGEGFNGAIGEIMFCNTMLTRAETDKVAGYLAWEWGTVDRLYALHPYKNRPPLLGD